MSINKPNRTDTKPWYKQFWPWLVIFFPAAAVVAGTATVIIAVVTDDGLVDDDYYKKGLLINISKKLDRQAQTLELGGYVRIDHSSGEIYVLMDSDLAKKDSDNLVVKLKHATRADVDQIIKIESKGGREFIGDGVKLVPGKWHVRVELIDQWRLTGQIMYPDRIDSRLMPITL